MNAVSDSTYDRVVSGTEYINLKDDTDRRMRLMKRTKLHENIPYDETICKYGLFVGSDDRFIFAQSSFLSQLVYIEKD